MKHLHLLICIPLFFLAACNNSNEKEKTIVDQIAAANGIEAFDDVEELRYTFNVRVNDTLRTSRNWQWRPQDKTATLITADTSITYNYETEAANHKQTDQQFINDQYWLLFPFHLAWDEMEYEHNGQATAPISGENMQQVIVTYPSDAGYTPGDVYEVYFGDDLIIGEWVYRSGGSTENPFPTTWENYQDYNGIKIAKMHRSGDGNFELFFSDVGVDFDGRR